MSPRPFVLLVTAFATSWAYAAHPTPPTRTVHGPIAVHGTDLGAFICQVLLSKYGVDAEHAGLKRDDLPVYALEEVWPDDQGSWYFPNTAPPDDGTIAELALTMHQARAAAGQNIAPFDPGSPRAGTAYFHLQRMTFGVRVDGREYRVVLAPKDSGGGAVPIAAGVFERKRAGRSWVYMADQHFPLERLLLAATEASPNVAYLATPAARDRAIAKAVRDRMAQYDLPAEIEGRPHFAFPENVPDLDVHYPDAATFVVRHPTTHERLGYLLVQDQVTEFQTMDTAGLYRNHFGPGSRYGYTTTRTVLRHIAHFDAEGNRVEVWKGHRGEPNYGRVVEQTIAEQQFQVYKGGFTRRRDREGTRGEEPPLTELPAEDDSPTRNRPTEAFDLAPKKANALAWRKTATMPQLTAAAPHGWFDKLRAPAFALSPNGRYLAQPDGNDVILFDFRSGKEAHRFALGAKVSSLAFSASGAKLLVGHVKTRARVIDIATGRDDWHGPVLAEDYMAPATVTAIEPLGGGTEYLLISLGGTSSRDACVVLLRTSTGVGTIVEKKLGKVLGVANDTAYVYDWHWGLATMPLKWTRDVLTVGSATTRTTSLGAMNMRVHHTERKGYRLLNPLGDHFVSAQWERGYEIHRLLPNGRLQPLEGLPRFADGKAVASPIFSGTQSFVASWDDRAVNVWWVGNDGKATDPDVLDVAAVRSATIAPTGDLLALATNDGTITVWALSPGSEPTRVGTAKTPRAVIALRFSSDQSTVLFEDDENRLGSAFTIP